MTKIKEHCVQIDDAIVVLRRHTQGMDVYNSMMKLGALADLIERHRQLVTNELEGLRGDVKSAETAYEREKIRADGLEQEKDRWTNECLPGWRKRVSEAERKERETRAAYDSNVAELKALALHAGDLEQDRDEWKRDAATSEAKLEKAINERDAYKTQRDGAEIALSKIAALAAHPDDVVDAEWPGPGFAEHSDRELAGTLITRGMTPTQYSRYWEQRATVAPEFAEVGKPNCRTGFDPGATEGDMTVTVFTCTCGAKRSFTQPKLYTWTHVSNCGCGAQTVLRSDADGRA